MQNRMTVAMLTMLGLVLPAVFVLFPILSFVVTSFWKLVDGQIVREFTLDNYIAFFTTNGSLLVYGSTILLSLEVTAINMIIATIIALFMSRRTATVRFLLLMAFLLPLFMSYIIKIYSIRGILGQRGILNEILTGLGVIDQPLAFLLFSRTAIFLTLAIVYLPYAILPIYLSLERIPPNILEASDDLGGTLKDQVFRILLPLAMPGILVAAVFTFVLTFGDFITPQMVGGTEGFTFGRIVYGQFGLALNWPLGAALAIVMLVTALGAFAIAGLAARRRLV